MKKLLTFFTLVLSLNSYAQALVDDSEKSKETSSSLSPELVYRKVGEAQRAAKKMRI
jgi:hypothetical protein